MIEICLTEGNQSLSRHAKGRKKDYNDVDEIQILRIPANIESDKDSLNRQQTDMLIKPTENLKDYVLT